MNDTSIPDQFETDESTGAVKIPISGKKHAGLFALVDPDDVDAVSGYRWYAVDTDPKKTGRYKRYVMTIRDRKTYYMHRLVAGVSDQGREVEVDHMNHDSLDNRRSNLRVVNRSENQRNRRKTKELTSRFKGVCWHIRGRKWMARITFEKDSKHLGMFDDEVEAARAYDAAARELFGEHACLNLPDEVAS